MSRPEANIAMILTDWLGALRRHDLEAVERSMAPDIVWKGVREDFVCPDRAAVLVLLCEWQREDHGVEALELVATEDRVVLRVRSTQLQEIGGAPLGGQIFNDFTLSDGRIVRIDDYLCGRAGRFRHWRPLLANAGDLQRRYRHPTYTQTVECGLVRVGMLPTKTA